MTQLASVPTPFTQAHVDQVVAIRSVVSSAWHGVAHAAATSPWFAIAVLVPAVGLLVGCTRFTVRRG